MTAKQLKEKTKELIGCDTVRLTTPLDTIFVIIGENRVSEGEYVRHTENGEEPLTFDYVHETVIASGKTYKAAWESVKYYKSLEGKTALDLILEVVGNRHSIINEVELGVLD